MLAIASSRSLSSPLWRALLAISAAAAAGTATKATARPLTIPAALAHAAELDPDTELLAAAEHEATQTIAQLGRDWLARCRQVCVQVRDEQHRPVLALSVAMKVERQGIVPD